eukprot:1188572-Prorocentrum_minimum.AAC.1
MPRQHTSSPTPLAWLDLTMRAVAARPPFRPPSDPPQTPRSRIRRECRACREWCAIRAAKRERARHNTPKVAGRRIPLQPHANTQLPSDTLDVTFHISEFKKEFNTSWRYVVVIALVSISTEVIHPEIRDPRRSRGP